MSRLIKLYSPLVIPKRFRSNKNYNWKDEGIQFTGFKYYPRHSDFKDPPYEPTKLFRVQRIKPLKGIPHYEKKHLNEIGLGEDTSQSAVAIVKNIPEINARLWKIKHLIKIVPITFPNGFPTDTKGTYLKENGELVVKKVLPTDQVQFQLADEFRKDVKRMDGDTLRRDSLKKWLTAWQ